MQGHRRRAVAAGLLWLAGGPALAAVEVTAAWSRAVPPVSGNGAAYAVFVNRGQSPEQLLGASTPVARRAELHTHVVQGDVVSMRRVPALDLPPGQQVRLRPGGLHVMLIGLKQPLSEGSSFALTFSFANAAPLTVDVPVLGADAAGARTGDGRAAPGPADHAGHGDHGGHAEHPGSN